MIKEREIDLLKLENSKSRVQETHSVRNIPSIFIPAITSIFRLIISRKRLQIR